MTIRDMHLLDGKHWFEHPKPRRWHRCFAATTAFDDDPKYGTVKVERCPCGAIRTSIGGRLWDEKNSR